MIDMAVTILCIYVRVENQERDVWRNPTDLLVSCADQTTGAIHGQRLRLGALSNYA